MSDNVSSKGLLGFVFTLVILILGLWFMYDLNVRNAQKSAIVFKTSSQQIEGLRGKVADMKKYFQVELDKIGEADSRQAKAQTSGGAPSGDLSGKVKALERKIRVLRMEIRGLNSSIRELEEAY